MQTHSEWPQLGSQCNEELCYALHCIAHAHSSSLGFLPWKLLDALRGSLPAHYREPYMGMGELRWPGELPWAEIRQASEEQLKGRYQKKSGKRLFRIFFILSLTSCSICVFVYLHDTRSWGHCFWGPLYHYLSENIWFVWSKTLHNEEKLTDTPTEWHRKVGKDPQKSDFWADT